jgi:hypothetical protein
MSDAGEGLVDASSRLAERMEELEEARRASRAAGPAIDPERVRAIESVRLAKADIERQLANTTHEGRRQQLTFALRELERRFADLEAPVRKAS